MSTIVNYLGLLPYAVTAIALLYVYRLVHDRLTPFDDHAEMVRGNAAAALTRGGAYLGVIIAMSGSLILSEQSYANDLLVFALDGVIALVVFTVACRIFDRVFLPHINNCEQIQQGNLAVAIMEFCGYVALGIIMSASFSGDGLDLLNGTLSSLVYSAIGLSTLTAIYLVYGLVWQKHNGRHVDREIESGNLTSAVDAGTLLLAMSITLWFSISGDFTGWGNDLRSYASAAIVSIFAVVISRALARVLIAPHQDRVAGMLAPRANNLATSTTVGTVSIGIGFIAGLVVFM